MDDVLDAPADAGQALVNHAPAGHGPSGFDPSRLATPLERAEAWHLHLYRLSEDERERLRAIENAISVVAPFVEKFAAAASHYDGGKSHYPGSVFMLEPEPGYRDALTVAFNGPVNGVPLNGPKLSDLRMLASGWGAVRDALVPRRDSDGSPEGRDAQRLDGEAATARAGTASPTLHRENPTHD